MKLFTTLLIIISSYWGEDGSYNETREEINIAISNRNFVQVRTLLGELMPEMKEELRVSKDLYSAAKKEGEKEELDGLKKSLHRKNEIYKSLGHLLEVSPAAIRARSGSLVKLLDEFNNLSQRAE